MLFGPTFIMLSSTLCSPILAQSAMKERSINRQDARDAKISDEDLGVPGILAVKLLFRVGEAITDAALGVDIAGRIGIGFDLDAELAHAHPQRRGIAFFAEAPGFA